MAEDTNYEKFIDALKSFNADLSEKIDGLRKDVDKKLDRLSTEYEKNREEIVRLTTHMEYMQTALSDARSQMSKSIEKLQEKATSQKDMVMTYITQRFKDEEVCRQQQLKELDKVIQDSIDLKIENSKLTIKAGALSAVIVAALYIVKIVAEQLTKGLFK